jgi:hypothetical protein
MSKLINKSHFTNEHVHFDYKLEAWMTCVFFTSKLDQNDLFDYKMSNWTSNQVGQKMATVVKITNGF